MTVLEHINSKITILDGGMGTLLFSAGLKPGELPERWNITNPEVIRGIHKDYFDAGSNIVNTNTFGANSLKFEKNELREIIKAAVANAKMAAAESKGSQEKYVAMDIGPTGKLLKPYGDLEFEKAVSVFKDSISLGVEYGADLIFIETMNDSYETKAALLAAKEVCDLPVFVSNAYGSDAKLMTGANPMAMVAMLEGMGADAIGVNCSLGPKALFPVIEEYLKYASVPVLFKPNAGLPVVNDGVTVYDVREDEFSGDIFLAIQKGVRIAGGCCGTTPAYIAAVSSLTAGVEPGEIIPKTDTIVSSYTHGVNFCDEPILIGERINPTGKKRFKQALIENDMDYILGVAVTEEEDGAHILDVNVGIPDIDEAKMLTETVLELQTVTDLPLQIDTSDTTAMESALRLYNGKAMINSVNGKEHVMDEVFPLVKKYGGVCVALTLDEEGIPETAEGRIRIAEKILKRAGEYGIDKKDVVFDTLTMTVSADPKAAFATLDSLEYIKKTLGCHTSLGVSNISFGLPERGLLNSTFFAMALTRGLSAAIMNPHTTSMMAVYTSFRALSARDENFAEYIEKAPGLVSVPVGEVTGVLPVNESNRSVEANSPVDASKKISDLQYGIIKGLKDKTRMLSLEMIKTMEPLDLVNNEVIPALNIVGEGFEKKTMFLPQLLMAAEAAKEAFEVVKSEIANSGKTSGASKCAFVIATVHGDIHDIGKNIVKLLLENYGFDVTDLGKDVPPEKVLEAVISKQAPICGLSALMTTTVPAMEETIKLIHEKAPFCKVCVGGAVLTPEYADAIGADKYCKDAMETVRFAESVNKVVNGDGSH